MRLTKEMVIRIVADVLLTNLAALAALAALQLLPFLEGTPYVLVVYRTCAPMLTVICSAAFYLTGLYTYGRVYRVRYKVLAIVQAVTIAHLVVGVVAFAVGLSPRQTLFFILLSWLSSVLLLGGVRAAPLIWSSGVIGSQLPVARSGQSSQEEVRRVLVIGGAGYIGSALVERLLGLGYKVRVLDLLLYGDDSISAFYNYPNFELIRGDFRNIHVVVSATQGMDAIVHLGAIVGDSACSIDQDLTVEINLRATRTIAEVGKGFGVKRFVFASTCSVYGASDEILDERSALRPISLYARTKMESEKVLLSLADATFSSTILRFGTIYGLSGRPRFDLVVNLLTAKAIQDGEAGIFGGRQWRPLVHVRDVAEAILLTLQAPLHNVRSQIFNVGSNEQNYQIADLGLIIKEMMPTAHVVTQPKEDNRNYRVRFDKVRNMLNFQPRYTVRAGIQEIIDAFATGKITDYRDPRYSNFSFLKLNGGPRSIFVEDVVGWAWVNLSPTDAMMLAEVVMAVIESQSQELMGRLRAGLVQAILGDIDGFLDTLTDMRLTSSTQAKTASGLDRQPVFVERWLEGRPPMVKPAAA